MNLQALKDTPPWEWPPDTGRVVLDLLRDERASESDLALAARFAGDLTIVNDDLVDALLTTVRSARSEGVGAQAAISLGPLLEYIDAQGFEDWDDLPIDERTFKRIQATLQELYADTAVPIAVRRGILEASVRAPQDWHDDAVRAAYASADENWKLTAVFCMCYVRGFDEQILDALDSTNPDIHYEAVRAAGNSEVDAAWPHVAALLTSRGTGKDLLLAAIEASTSIRPHEAIPLLNDLAESEDEDIVAAVDEAIVMADGLSADEEDNDLDEDE